MNVLSATRRNTRAKPLVLGETAWWHCIFGLNSTPDTTQNARAAANQAGAVHQAFDTQKALDTQMARVPDELVNEEFVHDHSPCD